MPSILIGILLFINCCQDKPLYTHSGQTQPVSHHIWDGLLSKYVDQHGNVNYAGFIKDSVMLNQYLKLLSDNPPGQHWSVDEQLAYWINAYNAFTIKLILNHYPIKSIKDITAINIPFVHSPWDIKFIRIGNETIDLNEIEHGILRKQFDEPRIHFAIVCASRSCPPLRREAYTAEMLDAQLDDQASRFINDPAKNTITAEAIQISKIFRWFKSDFLRHSNSIIEYLNNYSKVKIMPDAKISYLEYDWSLNE